MSRTCAALLAASLLLGCRSSQQATNPFLRTTVPPPGTGEAAVVVPAQPYYPGAPPAGPPAGATVVGPPPVTPVPVGPQPIVPPPRDLKKAVPGGSYIYHQSSREPKRRGDVEVASAEEDLDADEQDAADMAVNAAAPDAFRLGGASDAVEQALAMSTETTPGEDAGFEDYGSKLPGEEESQEELAVPPPRPKARTAAHSHAPIRGPAPAASNSEGSIVSPSQIPTDSS